VKLLKAYQTKAPQQGVTDVYEVIRPCKELKCIFQSIVFVPKE